MKIKSSFTMIALVVFSAFTLLTSCGEAEKPSVIKQIEQRGHMVVATGANQFPFSFKDKDGKLKGIDILIATRIGEHMGVDIKFLEVELSEIIETVEAGKADIAISGLSITAERNKKVLFTAPYFTTGKAILSNSVNVQSGKDKELNTEAISLAVIDNSSSMEYAKIHYPNAKLIITENIVESREALYTGVANGLLADYEICESLFFDKRNSGEYNFRRVSAVNDNEYIGVAVAPNDLLFFNLISNLVLTIKDGTVEEKIEESWLMYLN